MRRSIAALAQDIVNYLEKRPVQAEAFATDAKTPKRISAAATATRQPGLAVRPASTTGSEKSLAVLPFKLLNPNVDDASGDFIGIGLADALIARLSMVRRFVVRPTSSVLRFGDATDSLQAGRELGVDFVLEGNLRRTAERIRVTIQLLCVGEQAASWAGSFDEKNTEVLELEDSISEHVAKALIPHLTGAEQEQLAKRGTNNALADEDAARKRVRNRAVCRGGAPAPSQAATQERSLASQRQLPGTPCLRWKQAHRTQAATQERSLASQRQLPGMHSLRWKQAHP